MRVIRSGAAALTLAACSEKPAEAVGTEVFVSSADPVSIVDSGPEDP